MTSAMENASSSLCRRLRHLYLQKPTSTTAVLTSTPTPTPTTTTIDCKFQTLVNQFKKKSDSSGFRAKRLVYKTTVHRLAQAGHFSYIHDILHHQKQYPDIQNEHFTSRLICLYGQANMLDHALHLFDEMPHLNCPRTVLSFNALMSACLSSENFDKAIELFQELPKKLSIEPNVISYTTAIKAFCRLGSLDKAVSMLEEMENNGVDPNATTFDTLFSVFYYTSRFSEGEKLWALMKEKNVVPDLRCYNSRMHCMMNENRLSEAIEMFEELEEKGLNPNTYTYNVLIKGCVVEDNIEEAKKWFARLLESQCAPDFFTFMTLITFACDKKDSDFAFELCKKSVGIKKRFSGKIMQKVIDELIEQSKMDKAKELVELVNSTRGSVYGKLSVPTTGN